ncbi:MAG TPA: [FeFe] hydrogenase H-cluster maturation GTPase HydF [Candidatus Hydrogenedens sp.]|mgnify:CR=1 FL=1|nr:[FeFe] hydrogenase H-cluster maturation GTPase HydF [Candidatus Hydrogenedens sp.]HOL19936.1 [FeFe] hydrogenase H-cluster maturation GTPase HydF [Candidatus Hydrogenedens sp.]HPP59476.1 [FeFe] hydrogenase H-cluster maturation GTPase HydF [Candidatus Hydrogenedens sp.]
MFRASPKSFRLHIGFFGRRNVGKSSLLNAITRQNVSIVSESAGTTTDPVEKPMELLPLGPVLFIDTAGIDDIGALGELRIQKTRQIFDRTDVAVIVTESGIWGEFEESLYNEFKSRNIPIVIVFNKVDLHEPDETLCNKFKNEKILYVKTIASKQDGISELKNALISSAPEDFINSPTILGDLVAPGELAVLVVPIDKEAPKGRLIMPQVQSIRDLLDNDAMCVVVKERELRRILEQLKTPPKIVVTDSQAFLKVVADTPPNVWVTSFSILFSRFRGDLITQVEGTLAIESLKPGDKILIAESCSHHPIADDIGRVKIPRWLMQYVGGKLEFDTVQGNDFFSDLTKYKMVIHCGACTLNRRAMLNRIMHCKKQGIPISNYGLTIAYSLGILERALEPFPSALEIYKQKTIKKVAKH